MSSDIETVSAYSDVDTLPISTESEDWLSSITNGLEIAGLFFSLPAHKCSEFFIRSVMTPIRPGRNGNYSPYVVELATRIFLVTFSILTSPLTIGLALIGGVIEKISDSIKQVPYTHWRGKAKEKIEGKTSRLMTLNACMFWGGLPIPLGGMRSPNDRVTELAEKILKEDPDVLVLQEMAFDPSYQLYDKLKDHYSHFYVRIGPNPPLLESGLFVASKYPVLDAGHIPFPGQVGINRSAFWVETQRSFIFTTHLEFGEDKAGQEKRKGQFERIMKKIDECKERKNTYLLGDLNVDRSKTNEYNDLKILEKFHDPYFSKYPVITEKSSTCTNTIEAYILGKNAPKNPWELDDYALLAKTEKTLKNLDVRLVDTYNDEEPFKALSDHRGLVLTATSF